MENILSIEPVLSSDDLARDIKWYEKHLGCKHTFGTIASGYVGLSLEKTCFHLQWHHGDKNDPVNAGVIKFFVKDIYPTYDNLLKRKTITKDLLRLNTPWNTHEIGFYDLNKNAIFFVQDK